MRNMVRVDFNEGETTFLAIHDSPKEDHEIRKIHDTKSRRCKIFAVFATLTLVVLFGVVAFIVSPTPAPGTSTSSVPEDGGMTSVHEDGGMSIAATCGQSGTVDINGRKFELFVPSTLNANDPPPPLLVVWHGIASDPQVIESKMRFKPIAEVEKFVLAYPYGTGTPLHFNGAGCCNQGSIGQPQDDMQLSKDIVNYLATRGCINPVNVFTTGFSNGGFMSHKLACEAGLNGGGTPYFKAFATHSGLQGKDYVCGANAPAVPYMTFHADDDRVVGINGDGPLGMEFKSLQDVTAERVKLNGCTAAFTKETKTSTTVCTTYTSCNAPVETCIVSGGLGHSWSGEPPMPGDTPREDLPASQLFIDFFKNYVV